MNDIERWIRPEIRALTAYHVPESAGLVKLDAMENPYAWPESLVSEWLAILRDVCLNRYPDPSAQALKSRLSEVFALPANAEILLGNGSDELIQMIALAVSGPGRAVLAPEPGFSMYRMISIFAGLEYIGVPLHRDDFSLDVAAIKQAMQQHQPAIVFLAYPNNPVGNLFDEKSIREIAEAAPGLVVIDEAYQAFADSTLMGLLDEYNNLLVLRTLSKMGLAGLRFGYLIGAKAWLTEIDKVRLPYNVGVLTQVSADFALNHYDVLDGQARQICEDREQLFSELSELDGIEVYPSHANFILFRVPAGRGREIFESIRSQGVLIKNLHGHHDFLNDCLRVTVGKREENDAFLSALRTSLS